MRAWMRITDVWSEKKGHIVELREEVSGSGHTFSGSEQTRSIKVYKNLGLAKKENGSGTNSNKDWENGVGFSRKIRSFGLLARHLGPDYRETDFKSFNPDQKYWIDEEY